MFNFRSFTGFARMAAFFAIAFAASACVDLSPSTLQGKYLGSWMSASKKESIPVTAQITAVSKNSAEVVITCASTAQPCHFDFEIDRVKRSRVSLDVSGDLSTSLSLTYDSSDSSSTRPCLSSDSGELCVSDDQLTAAFVDQNGVRNTFTLTRETPPSTSNTNSNDGVGSSPAQKDFKLSELMKKASNYDFSTRIEYERYLESRYNAKAALLSQLPHVNIGTLGNLLSGLNPGSLISVVGDLAPFLLPNRWMEVKEANLASQAEQLSMVMIRLNAVLFTETLSYAYLRDTQTIQKLGVERSSVQAIYDELKMREDLGQLNYGTSQDIAAILNAIDQSQLQLQESVKADLMAIGLSVGFTDPHAVHSIVDDIHRTVQHPSGAVEVQFENTVVARSHEIEQADFLFRAAKIARVEKFFSWLDPTAPPQLSIGAALFPVAQSAAAQVAEFEDIKEQIIASTTNKAANTYLNYDYAIKNETLTLQASQIQADRVKRLLAQLEYGTNFVLADLVNALQDQVVATVSEAGNEALYQVTEAQMDRMLLNGLYANYDSSFMQ